MDRRAARRVSQRPSGSRSQVEPELALDAKGNFLALRAASFVPLTKGTEAEARGIGLGAYVELQSGAAGTRRGYGAPGRYRRDGHRHLVEPPGPRDELCAAARRMARHAARLRATRHRRHPTAWRSASARIRDARCASPA